MGFTRDDLDAPASRASGSAGSGPSITLTTTPSTPGRRAARAGDVRASAPTAPYAGRRVAARPVDAPSTVLERTGGIDAEAVRAVLADLEPADQTTCFADEPTGQMPALPMDAAPPVTSPGKRRATKQSVRRGPLFRVPSAPLLLGLAALAISATGAVTTGGADLVSARPGNHAGAAGALSGSSGTGSVVSDRATPASRGVARAAVPTTDQPADGDGVAVDQSTAQQRSDSLAALDGKAEKYSAVIAKNQWGTPLDSYRLTARFGQYGLWSSYHTGLDFAAPSGTPIHAIANGVVTSTGYDGSYGNKTVMTLDDGTELWYCHQSAYAVSVGDTVRGGDLLGYVGSTGNVTGPHVHIEVRPGGGDPIDPYPAFVEHGVTP